jgi:hypothetical protein
MTKVPADFDARPSSLFATSRVHFDSRNTYLRTCIQNISYVHLHGPIIPPAAADRRHAILMAIRYIGQAASAFEQAGLIRKIHTRPGFHRHPESVEMAD